MNMSKVYSKTRKTPDLAASCRSTIVSTPVGRLQTNPDCQIAEARKIARSFVFLNSHIMVTFRIRLQVAAMVFFASLSAGAVEIAGVKFDEGTEVAGSKLVLNGAGIRYKAVFKVYAAGLYLTRKASTPEAVTAASGPKRMSITMLRDIDSGELGKLFSRGIEDNMERGAFVKLIPGVMRMSQVFTDHKKLLAGETFMVDWIPGRGTVLTVKGKVEGEPFKEPEFFNALMAIWLGRSPADWQLKEQLLGQKT
jgi:hypothetical protein